MPTYNYECNDCQHKFTDRLPIHLRNNTKCPECGSLNCQKLLGLPSGFILKGDGFYETIKKQSEEDCK